MMHLYKNYSESGFRPDEESRKPNEPIKPMNEALKRFRLAIINMDVCPNCLSHVGTEAFCQACEHDIGGELLDYVESQSDR